MPSFGKTAVSEPSTEYIRKVQRELRQAAPSLGIDQIGFASADPFLTLKQRLIRRREKGYDCGFEEPDMDKRVYPHKLFDDPQSIISIAVAYPSRLKNPPRSVPGAYRGMLARTAWGEDYHRVLWRRLQRLEGWLKERFPGARMKSMVDTGALSDRAVAERAGIGWSAKNCAIISPQFGSWIFLGEMITNIPFEPDEPVTNACGDCTKCLDACPTGALVGPGELDAKKCLSFLTQTKTFVPDEYKEKMGNRLYGCDTCQVVCPKNKGLDWTHQAELQPDPEEVKPLLIDLLKLSNREFRERYGRNASSWRGKNPVQRNTVIALGHFRDRASVPVLRELLLNDPRPVMRETAAWALGRIGGEEALQALRDGLAREKDGTVLEALGRHVQTAGETLQ